MIDFSPIESLATTLLSEGQFLYPYRRSALKNQRCWTFGCLFPPAWTAVLGEPSWLQAECLLRGGPQTRIAWRCRFLSLLADDVIEDCLDFPTTPLASCRLRLSGESPTAKPQAAWRVTAEEVNADLWRLRVRIENMTSAALPCPLRDDALRLALCSCHLLFGVEGGEFVSAIDPPADCRAFSMASHNVGVWPVLVGQPAAPTFMIAAPIILYDFPQVAPQSPAILGEVAEIDEMLRLRVLTLTDHERQETRCDDRGRNIIDPMEMLDQDKAQSLRGVWRSDPHPGDRVRLKPTRRADALDFALAERQATIVSVDVDLEGKCHVGVVLDDDPGRDLGLAGWPGHRFFFSLQEIEPL